MAHPNVQQLLASIWYESVPGFRRKNMLLQAAEMVRIGVMFPLYSLAYIAAPHSTAGRTLRKPFIKFLCHSASYFMFLCKETKKHITNNVLRNESKVRLIIINYTLKFSHFNKHIFQYVTNHRGVIKTAALTDCYYSSTTYYSLIDL